MLSLFVLILPRLPSSSLFPYTTLFRSWSFRERKPGSQGLQRYRNRLGWRPGQTLELRRQNSDGRNILYLRRRPTRGDRKSTRLNSSHTVNSYAVFCLKKKTPRLKVKT